MIQSMKKVKNAAAVSLGRLGGRARVSKGIGTLSEEERKAMARRGAEARWGVKGEKESEKKPSSKAP
jgi:hypothetical protein